MSSRPLLPCTVALALLVACGQAGDVELGVVQQPMIEGTQADESYGGVVFLETKQPAGKISCTGTLVAPNLVATALHCVTSSPLGHFNCQPDGSITASTVQEGAIGPLVAPSNVKVYTGSPVDYSAPVAAGARLYGTGSTQGCQGDLALVQLDHALDAPVAPVRLDRMASWKERVHVLGYGETDVAANQGYRLLREVQVIDVGPGSTAEPARTASPRTFVVGEGPCKGDSGGPALSADTGALLGVFSLNENDDCSAVGIRNVYTSLSPFSKMILDAFDKAGAEPQLEPGAVLEQPDPEPTKKADAGGCTLSPAGTSASSLGLALLGLAALASRLRRRRS
ncbi:MAG TPA: trypsin-like serine protease [Polyangiaceae bacterium]|nr:trypsin-like serine protease [Polyangiaceae bacterium]